MGKFLGKAEFRAEDVLDWNLERETLRQALIDAAGLKLNVTGETVDTWWGEVRYDHEYGVFEVTLWEGEP